MREKVKEEEREAYEKWHEGEREDRSIQFPLHYHSSISWWVTMQRQKFRDRWQCTIALITGSNIN